MKYLIRLLFLFTSLFYMNYVESQSFQTNELRFKANRIDGFAIIGGDSIFVDKADYTRIVDSMYSSNKLNAVIFSNKSRTQYFKASGQETDGYWNNYFTIGYNKQISKSNELKTNDAEFVANNFIKLGLTNIMLSKYLEMSPNCILVKGTSKIYKFYWFDKASLNFQQYKTPQYVASFIFEKDILTKFGFGNYLGELDKDFFPKGYKVIKGEVYQ
jgi:hypothetical protein